MSKNVVLTLESRFMDEYGEYANLPVFNAHGSIVGYVGGEVPESGNPCEFNRLNDEGFTFCASATEVVRLKAENAKLREQIHWLKQGDILHVLTDQEYIDQCERERLMQVSIDALDKDNAKLRELVRDYEHCSMHADCDRCEYDGTTSTHCPLSPCFPDIDELRELGVEVDE